MDTARTRPTARKTKKLVDQVYHELQRRIVYNLWEAGHQALEHELAEELGVSRTPVREALIRLQRDGLVKVVPRHGMRVLPISARDIEEIYQILTSLEALAVELAALRKPTATALKPLERAAQNMKAAHLASDLQQWAKADEQFHRHLVELSGNRILTEIVDSFWSRSQRARLTMLALRKSSDESLRKHTLLVNAIRDGDSAAARSTLETHRAHGALLLKRLLAEHRKIQQFA